MSVDHDAARGRRLLLRGVVVAGLAAGAWLLGSAASATEGEPPTIVGAVASAGSSASGPAGDALAPVVTIVEPVAASVSEPGEAALEPAAEAVQVVPALDPVMEPVVDAVEPVVQPVTDPIEPVIEPVTDAVEPAIHPVTDAVEPIVEPVTRAVPPVTDVVEPITEAVTPTHSVPVPAPAPVPVPVPVPVTGPVAPEGAPQPSWAGEAGPVTLDPAARSPHPAATSPDRSSILSRLSARDPIPDIVPTASAVGPSTGTRVIDPSGSRFPQPAVPVVAALGGPGCGANVTGGAGGGPGGGVQVNPCSWPFLATEAADAAAGGRSIGPRQRPHETTISPD
ncbi:hypothetical protein [Nakamurella sp.]|uniref:hypothetical protein n=1 Tax=Nakamurella sp. TaxID=1869182 RepID=UPI003B3A83AC